MAKGGKVSDRSVRQAKAKQKAKAKDRKRQVQALKASQGNERALAEKKKALGGGAEEEVEAEQENDPNNEEQEDDASVGSDTREFWDDNAGFASTFLQTDLAVPKKKKKKKRGFVEEDLEELHDDKDAKHAADVDNQAEEYERVTRQSFNKDRRVDRLPIKSSDGSWKVLSTDKRAKLDEKAGIAAQVDEADKDEDVPLTSKQKKQLKQANLHHAKEDQKAADVERAERSSKENVNKEARINQAKAIAAASASAAKLTPAEREKVRETKMIAMATLAEQILEDPELAASSKPTAEKSGGKDGPTNKSHQKHMHKKNKAVEQAKPEAPTAKLGNLYVQLHSYAKDEDKAICKLAMLSQLAVYKDVLPGYRIRLPTEKEKSVLLTKEVRLLRRFERALLEGYQAFLKVLERNAREGGALEPFQSDDGKSLTFTNKQRRLARVAVRCMCTMLVCKPGFNFHENLLASVVPMMNSKDEDVSRQCCSCITSLVQQDVSGETTLDTVRMISSIVNKNAGGSTGRVRPSLLAALLDLRLKADLKDVAKAIEVKKSAKRRKKMRQTDDEVMAGLDEAEASADKVRTHARHAEALRALFLVYLRVLKRAPQSDLLPIALEGVMQYVHLINLDVVESLLAVLGSLTRANALGIKSGLHAVLAVTVALQGPGKELNVDEGDFASYLYSLLYRMSHIEGSHQHTRLVVRCVDTMMLRRTQVSTERVAAFIRRLLALAMAFPPNCAIALVTLVRALMTRYPKCDQLLEDETDRIGSATSLALNNTADTSFEGADLEHAGALDSSAWELSMLSAHFHPGVVDFTRDALAKKPLLPTQKAHLLYEEYDTSEGGFNPPVQEPTLKAASNGGGEGSKSKTRKRRRDYSRSTAAVRESARGAVKSGDVMAERVWGSDLHLANKAEYGFGKNFENESGNRRRLELMFALKRRMARVQARARAVKTVV